MKNVKISEQYSDMEVIKEILAGETALYEILIRRCNQFLYKIGRSYNYNHADTQDLMQDTLIDAYINLSKFEGRSSFRTWVIKIMLNNCYRKKQKFSFKNEVRNEINEKSIPMFSDQYFETNRALTNKELNAVIENALSQVPLEYKMVFTLREMTGLNVKETAEALNITEVNVKVRLNRAKAMLKREIEKSYTAEDLFEFNLIYCDGIVEKVMTRLKEINR